jgi:uncharacterized protein (DUF305 family)
MVLRKKLFLGVALGMLFPLGSVLSACGDQTPDTAGGNQDAMVEHHGDMMHHGDIMHDMDLGPADATYDLRFIDAMIMHHEGAIVMAEAALENSERAEIRQLATEIIAEQEREIAQMQEWRQAWYPDAPAEPVMYHAGMGHDMPMTDEMAAAMRMDMDLGPADDEFDLRFINAMIPHHEGAVEMAEDLRENSDRPEMQALADDIISAQQAEIDQMATWRQDWYGQ